MALARQTWERRTRPPARELSQVEVLQGVCRALGSAADLDEANRLTVRWARAAVARDDAAVRIALPDWSGTLRSAISAGHLSDGSGRASAKRRMVFETKTPLRLSLRRSPGLVLAMLPLVCRGEPVGVLEVIAPGEAIDERWGTLEAVASQAAIAIRNLRERAEVRRGAEALAQTANLARALVGARSPEAAVRAATAFLHERFAVPVAAWFGREETSRLSLLAVRGVGARKRQELRGEMPTLPRWDLASEQARNEAIASFAHVVGAARAGAGDAGSAVLLVGGSTGSMLETLTVVGMLLEDVLNHLDVIATARRRNERLDLGIAWTAHEVRGPLLGARAAIEVLLDDGSDLNGGRELLRRLERELAQLANLVDPLLRWAVGRGTLRRRTTDVVRLVRDAVDSCSLETGQDRTSVSAPPRLMVRADPKQLRGAIANVLRNALTYSPAGSEVRVSVEPVGEGVVVSVRDRGPGVSPEERESIFDPFVRGETGRVSRDGKGLGLFIAKRVVEAHDGRIWLESDGSGAAFHMWLPARPRPAGAVGLSRRLRSGTGPSSRFVPGRAGRPTGASRTGGT